MLKNVAEVAEKLEKEGFEVKLSEDGKRFVARKFAAKEAEPTKEDARIIPILAVKNSTEKDELLARIADYEARDYECAADIEIRQADRLGQELAYHEKRLTRLKKHRRFAKKAVPAQVIGIGLIGLVLGVVLAVSQLLENHGPTVTIWGTIAASGIYLLSGLFWMFFFGVLGRLQAIEFVDDYTRRIREHRDIIDELREEIAEHQTNANELAAKASAKRAESRKFRGNTRF